VYGEICFDIKTLKNNIENFYWLTKNYTQREISDEIVAKDALRSTVDCFGTYNIDPSNSQNIKSKSLKKTEVRAR